MTKKELIKKLDDVNTLVESIIGSAKTILDDAKILQKELEELPSEESEIEDSGDDEP